MIGWLFVELVFLVFEILLFDFETKPVKEEYRIMMMMLIVKCISNFDIFLCFRDGHRGNYAGEMVRKMIKKCFR